MRSSSEVIISCRGMKHTRHNLYIISLSSSSSCCVMSRCDAHAAPSSTNFLCTVGANATRFVRINLDEATDRGFLPRQVSVATSFVKDTPVLCVQINTPRNLYNVASDTGFMSSLLSIMCWLSHSTHWTTAGCRNITAYRHFPGGRVRAVHSVL